jgi:DNA-binding response OmpR family regulator
MKILVIEDDRSLQEVIVKALEQEHYVVETASAYQSALFKLSDYTYDCVLLDINLPGGNGLDLLREFRKMKKSGNVIIISARNSVEDKVVGLDLGADDYLAKPFHIAELLSRIKSVLRRSLHQGEEWLTLGNVRVQPHTFEVTIDGRSELFQGKEFDFLLYFMQRPGRLVSKQTLAEDIWGDHFDGVDNFDFLYAQIKRLRKHLIAVGADIEITSVYGMGYKLTAP